MLVETCNVDVLLGLISWAIVIGNNKMWLFSVSVYEVIIVGNLQC
jgi:hypothetical protein